MIERKDSKWFIHKENECFINVQQGRGCDNDPISQLHERKFKKEAADYDLKFYIDGFNFAQDEKNRRGLMSWVQLNYL